MKRIYAIKEYCIGCGLCELYCAVVHSHFPEDILKAYKLAPDELLSRTIVERSAMESFSSSCRQCREPFCLEACISGAIYRYTADEIILINEEKCVGCGTCVVACPYGAIKLKKTRAVKCDLCYQSSSLPACVVHCPNRALVYKEEEMPCAM